MKDLADYSYPLTDLFAQPTSSDQWDRYRLSQDQIDFFHENGYLHLKNIISDELCQKLIQEAEEHAHGH